ncbi:hypothetical protein B0H16DRAFT_1749265 [Mycena metata]|uniref:Uncharacterized protein n=1 Tax=Mycena metata TaxID=1033252 RepID=A0AAD7DV12_9AGAR|nr:hypothetical protein B0H16DRAFT_1749265 [Mycena metata]
MQNHEMNTIDINAPEPGNARVWDALRTRITAALRSRTELTSFRQSVNFRVGDYMREFGYRVECFPPTAEDSSTKWDVCGRPRRQGSREILLGRVVIDPLVYANPQPVQDRLANGQLVLDLLARAVETDCVIRMAVEVRMEWEAQTLTPMCVERLLARSFPLGDDTAVLEDNIVGQFRERMVATRFCGLPGCNELLPAVGPACCPSHVNTPTLF